MSTTTKTTTTTTTTHHSYQARALWRWCLISALRTALACIIVGWITIYGPQYLRTQIRFPAFSYVVVILIATDATLGDTLHSCWLAFYATIQTVGPAIISLWLIGPARFTIGVTSLAVSVASIVVSLPEGPQLVAKRIALGQIILLYVVTCSSGGQIDPVMHPLRLAVSTGVGVLACVLALLLPFPRLGYSEVKQNCKLLAENASERLKLYVNAFSAGENAMAMVSVAQAKLLASAGTKLLQNIKRYQENVKWETFPFRFWITYDKNPAERFQALEMPLRGMEMALTSMSTFPARMVEGEKSKEGLTKLEEHITQTIINQIKNYSSCDSLTVPEKNSETVMESLQTLQTISPNLQDLPSFFFLFCMKLLNTNSSLKPTTPAQENQSSGTKTKQDGIFRSIWSNWVVMKFNSRRLIAVFKCSLSLGLAVFFGLVYSKKDGIWSGLPVAISMAFAREATFRVANIKIQGTVIGSVYGVFACLVFERFVPLRFLSLLPWFIFTNFLRRSAMYGQAGGISAIIGALLILGRKGFGPPSDFAMVRISEAIIGLSCSIMVELLMQPTRASSLAKIQLSKTLGTLHDCFVSVGLGPNKGNLVESHSKLKSDVIELKKFIGEAEAEPNFWFLPFHNACYSKLLVSMSKVVDLFAFSTRAVGLVVVESESLKNGENSWMESVKKLDGDIQLFKEIAGSLVKCLKDITSLKSLSSLEKEIEKKNISADLENGKFPSPKMFTNSGSGEDEDETEKIMSSYLLHLKECGDEKGMMVLSLSALGFCMSNLMKEAREIEKGINELVQWENPTNHVNLYEISCKFAAYTAEQ